MLRAFFVGAPGMALSGWLESIVGPAREKVAIDQSRGFRYSPWLSEV